MAGYGAPRNLARALDRVAQSGRNDDTHRPGIQRSRRPERGTRDARPEAAGRAGAAVESGSESGSRAALACPYGSFRSADLAPAREPADHGSDGPQDIRSAGPDPVRAS